MSSLLSELMTSGGWMLHAGRANKPCGLGDHPTPASQSGGTPNFYSTFTQKSLLDH
jgi:hypothetical protein